MNKISCYNGILYKIEYKPELSQKDYTQRHVYHIKIMIRTIFVLTMP